MLKTLGKKLMNNFGLKLLAILLAIVLWMVVINIDDPAVRKTMTLSVTMKNQDYITEMGKYMDILGDSNTVTFTYTTKRGIWENISSTDFSATADLKKIEAKENGTYRVPVIVSAIRNASQITIESKQLYLEVTLEDLGKKQFQIKANTSGTVADGCALGNVTIDNANVVQVSGPVSLVNAIDSVVATVNVDGMSADITDNVVPVFYDVNGEVIDTTKLEKSIDTVNITAQILNTKDIPLELSYMGEPEAGYCLTEVLSNPKTVRVKGTAATLNTLDRVVVPAEVLDLTGVTSDVEKTIDISTYLPEGVSLVISSDAKVNITAKIEAVETKEFRIPISNITAIGLKEGYQLAYAEKYLNVTISAGSTALGNINTVNIKGSLNVENLKEGTHTVAIAFELDNTIYKVSEALTEISIIRTDENSAGNTENNSESNTENNNNSGGTTDTETSGGTTNEGNTENSGGTSNSGSTTTPDNTTEGGAKEENSSEKPEHSGGSNTGS